MLIFTVMVLRAVIVLTSWLPDLYLFSSLDIPCVFTCANHDGRLPGSNLRGVLWCGTDVCTGGQIERGRRS